MLIPLLALSVAGQMIKPPVHRIWTSVLSDSTEVQAVRNGVVYYTSQLTAGALNAQTGKLIWSQKLNGWNSKGTINRESMFVVSQTNKTNFLYSINLKTGVPKKLAEMTGSIGGIACDEERLYVLSVSTGMAFDVKSGTTLWKKDYFNGKSHDKMLLGCVTAGFGKVFVGIDGVGLQSVDPKTGNVIWKVSPQYGSYNPPTLTQDGALTRFDGIQLLSYSNGKPKWTLKTSSYQILALMGKVLVTKDNGKLVGFDASSGRGLWSSTAPVDKSSRSGGNRDHLPADKDGAMINDEGFFHVTVAGKVDWTVKPTFDGGPIYADSNLMICNDGNRLLGYKSGNLEPLPTNESQKKELALKLVASFEMLDKAERDRIVKLASYAAQPLIRKFVSWSKDYDKHDSGERSGLDMMLYDLLTSTPEMLDQMCTHADTKALVQALTDMGPKGQYLDEIKKVLGRRGDPSQVMPIYIASLKAKRGMSGRDSSDPATLKAVSLSKSPEAVQFMIDALDDITAPDDWRHEAFIHLPGTGGEAGIRAVQRARHKPGPRPTWQESLTKRINRTDLITQGTDAKGRSWRLVESGIFGNSSDLFIQEQKGTKWGDAVFLNIYTGRTFGGEIPNNYKGIPMTKLIETEWLNVFTDDPSIRIDSDADGLTDLVEQRLGTDPKTADMDGDGLKDSVDPCPNAAPRVLNDKEKIIAACVEAKFFAQSWEVPAIVSVKDIKPFEMLGLDCFLLWQSDGKNNSLGKMYGAGMNRIGFSPPMKNFEDSTEGKDVIQISPDGKSAETLISRYSGGLNGEGEVVKLIKRGDEWFVIAIEMRFVS